jgi:hypothetical protein
LIPEIRKSIIVQFAELIILGIRNFALSLPLSYFCDFTRFSVVYFDMDG